MSDQEAQLIQKRAELKQMINEGKDKTFPAYFYKGVGRVLARIFHLKKQPHWAFSAFVLAVLAFLPGILIAIATKEIYQWKFFEWISHVAALNLYLASVVAHLNIVYNVLPGIRDYIVDAIQSISDLGRLEKWLNSMWSASRQLTFIIWVGVLYGVSIVLLASNIVGRFVGIGYTITSLIFSIVVTISIYFVLCVLTLPAELSDYQLDVYESDPPNSEVIQRLVYILNVYIYYVAGYCAVGTLFLALIPELSSYVWYFILLGWVPTIAQFLANQYGIRKLTIRAKWRYLNRLQAQIKEIQIASLINAPEITITRLNQLMDLHDRISARPNSVLNWGTGLSFFNQLMLPLLALLLGNIDKLLKLLAQTP
jgi:hypothetical protein